MTQKLVDILEGEGEEPRIKLPADVVTWMRNRPQPPSYNAYICRRRSQHIILAIDIHSGVTPMFLGCKYEHCASEMISAGYPGDGAGPVPQHLRGKPVWIWYRPADPEFRTMPPELRGHIMQGGLALRRSDKTLEELEEEFNAHH